MENPKKNMKKKEEEKKSIMAQKGGHGRLGIVEILLFMASSHAICLVCTYEVCMYVNGSAVVTVSIHL